MKASEWIDRVKAQRGIDSDYAVAKALGLSRATVSKYRSRTPTLDDDSAVKVAEALGTPVEYVLIDQSAERAKSEPVRAALRGALHRLGGAVAGVAMATGAALVSIAASPAPAQAGGLSPSAADGSVCIMYSKINLVR